MVKKEVQRFIARPPPGATGPSPNVSCRNRRFPRSLREVRSTREALLSNVTLYGCLEDRPTFRSKRKASDASVIERCKGRTLSNSPIKLNNNRGSAAGHHHHFPLHFALEQPHHGRRRLCQRDALADRRLDPALREPRREVFDGLPLSLRM